LGIYGFTKEALDQIANWPVGDLESIEKLEQLRWLEHGQEIQIIEVERPTFGVDTPDDLDELLERMDQLGLS
jgi:3-deoxy-manno-octulosonate cytidylyltransferase (CMP-KDO synthetase)